MINKMDYLILLVGTNPIPNFISALSTAKEGTKVYMVYTLNHDGLIGTESIAENIGEVLREKFNNLDIQLVNADKSNVESIRKVFDYIFACIAKENTGYEKKYINLDYTGGTKMMAAQFYYDTKQIEKKIKNYSFSYSYVDSEINRIKMETSSDGEVAELISEVAKKNNISIEYICKLHGFKIKEYSKNIVLVDKHQKEVVFDALYIKDFQLCCVKHFEGNNKNKCKLNLFMAKDKAEKLGGEQVKLVFVCDYKKTEVLQKELEKAVDMNLSESVKVINPSDLLQEEIKNFL